MHKNNVARVEMTQGVCVVSYARHWLAKDAGDTLV
jgi:hypothetical protein